MRSTLIRVKQLRSTLERSGNAPLLTCRPSVQSLHFGTIHYLDRVIKKIELHNLGVRLCAISKPPGHILLAVSCDRGIWCCNHGYRCFVGLQYVPGYFRFLTQDQALDQSTDPAGHGFISDPSVLPGRVCGRFGTILSCSNLCACSKLF